MDGAGAGGAARERRKQLTAAEAVNHKRQLAQMVERELALTGADSVTDFDDALQMVLVETAFGRYPKHLLDVYTGKVVGRQERGDVVKSWQHVEKMSAPGGATGDEGNDGFGDDDEILLSSLPPAEALKMLKAPSTQYVSATVRSRTAPPTAAFPATAQRPLYAKPSAGTCSLLWGLPCSASASASRRAEPTTTARPTSSSSALSRRR